MRVELSDTSEQDWTPVSLGAVRTDCKSRFKTTKSDMTTLHRAVFHIAHKIQFCSSIHIYTGLLNIWMPIQLILNSSFCRMKIA